ncbi:MAG: hypothetical protein HY287_03975 [Planctomycetes bacterium]|nr:hypothetical protein [Planctomycetota bacterium]MBI3833471.1 hypothetical protein [Planctomycetota bacterium]
MEQTAETLDGLLLRVDAFENRKKVLLTSDEGKRVAHDPAGLMSYMELDRSPVAGADDLRARREIVAGLLSALRQEAAKVDVGFLPDEAVRDQIDEQYFWAKDRTAKLAVQESLFDKLVKQAPTAVELAKAKTLEQAILDYRARWFEFLRDGRIVGEEQAKEQSQQVITDAAKAAELDRARAEAERLLSEARAETERMRVDYELRIEQQVLQEKERQAQADIRYQDTLAELERLRKTADAERHAKDIDTQVKTGRMQGDAEKKLLKERCHEPKVQQTLAPFLSKGYLRPDGTYNSVSFKGNYDSSQPVPISFKDLLELGALAPSGSGCDTLYSIGKDPRDTIRMRWPQAYDWRTDSRTRELVPDAQKLLSELGPTLVELGMLQP